MTNPSQRRAEHRAARADLEQRAAIALDHVYTDWWAGLDGIERRRARTFLGWGIPDDIADRMTSCGIELHTGLVGDLGGLRHVRLAPSALIQFIAAHPLGRPA